MPLTYRASPSLAMIVDDKTVLFDIGPGTLRQLSRIGINHDKIQQIFISHFHPDHTADLIHFLFATCSPSTVGSRKPFTITGPNGFKAFLKNLQNAYGRWLDVPVELMEIEELDTNSPEEKSYVNYTVTSQPVVHTSNSLAYSVQGRAGNRFVYSGDTEFCDEIVALAKGSDLLILECSFPEGEGVEGHLTPSRAGRIATLAGVKKLLLIHFYPEVLATDIAEECRKTYSGELILGRDILHVSI